jgi:intracellular septation protein
MDKTQPHPLFKLATELGPLIVFFVVNAKFQLFAATGAFMVAIVAAMIASYVVTRHVPIMALVTGVIVLVFGTLTLVLHDETFIKVKPTIIYGLFAAVLRPLLHRHHVRSDVQPDAAGLAHPHLPLGAVLRRHGGAE